MRLRDVVGFTRDGGLGELRGSEGQAPDAMEVVLRSAQIQREGFVEQA
ncbi:hypothetical protein [Kibdelosporangium philippinense]